MIVGETAAEQEAWHRVIADVIDQLKHPKEKNDEQSAAPGSLAALTRDISAPVTIGSDAKLEGEASNPAGVDAGSSLPSSHLLTSDSPPVLAPVANAGNNDHNSGAEIPPMPAPASGSLKNVHAENRSPAHSQEGEATSHSNTDQQANGVSGSPAHESTSPIATGATSSPTHAASGSILSSSPARKTADQRIPAIAALDEPSSGSASPAPGQVSSDSQSSAASAAMRHPSVSNLQPGSAHYTLTRRPSLSNLLVPVPKASGCLDIPHLNAADIEGQLALLVDDLKFISNALSWREAPYLDLASFEASLTARSPQTATTATTEPSITHTQPTPVAETIAEPQQQTEVPAAVAEPAIVAHTEEKKDVVVPQETHAQEPVAAPTTEAVAETKIETHEPVLTPEDHHAAVTAPSQDSIMSPFSQLHNQSSPMLHSSQEDEASKLGASTGSIDDALRTSSSNQFEVVPTVTTTQDESAHLPSIPSVDPKTHPRLSSRWPSPRSSLTQQLFLALDATDADREAMLDDIIGDIDDATSSTPRTGFRSPSERDYNDAETTADLLAALMDPEHSNYSASPSSYQTSPLELAMQQKHQNESYTHIASSSGVGNDANAHDGDASSSAPSSDAHHANASSANADGTDKSSSDLPSSATGSEGVDEELKGTSFSSVGGLGKSNSGFGSGGWTKPERRPTALGFAASSHRTATATEIQQLEKVDADSRLRRLRERLISPEDPYEIYDCSERAIGKGGMGEVFFATLKRPAAGVTASSSSPGSSTATSSTHSHKKVAIKKLQTFFKGKDRLPTILNEINVMAHSKHPNIINYIASYQVDQELWVAMEYMDKGSLYDLVRLNIKLDEKHMAYIIKQIVYALTFVHDLKRVHRDIKVDNILMSSRGEIKLADFGAAVQLTFQRLKRTTMTGTPYYMSPEVIGGKQYDELVDVWSLGILCIELAEKAPPYYDLPPDQALDRIVKEGVKGLHGRRYSSDFLDFVNTKCLQIEPSKRWTAAQLQNHPFLKKAVTQQEFAAHLESQDSLSQVDSGCTIL